jgi:hypothetical protein
VTAAAIPGIAVLGRPPARRTGLWDTEAPRFSTGSCGWCGLLSFWLDDSEEIGLDKHAMDVDTAETVAGVVRLLRRASVVAWAAADRAGAGSPGQLFALGLDLAADQHGNWSGTAPRSRGRCRLVTNRPVCCGRWSACYAVSRRWRPRTPLMIFEPRWPIWCGRRTPVSAFN